MTPELLTKAATALYGTRFQTDLARDLGVTRRTIQRWLNCQNKIPAIHDELVIDLLSQHGLTINKIKQEITG